MEPSRLTLSGLLNMLDGVLSTEGRIIIMTSNYPEVLDKALIRPGRIDVKEYFGRCDQFQIGQLFEMFYVMDCPNELLSRIDTVQLK